MPGILYHLLFAKTACNDMNIRDTESFYLGNILPDSATDKRGSHYWRMPGDEYEVRVSGFRAPDLSLAKIGLSKIANSDLRIGLYGHYYLDWRFTKELLTNKFAWDINRELIFKQPDNKKSWTIEEFFSPNGLYRGYGEINPIIFENGLLSLAAIDQLPDDLPATGIPVLDQHKPQNWKDELHAWLKNPPTYTGEIFAYSELINFVRKCATEFRKDTAALWKL